MAASLPHVQVYYGCKIGRRTAWRILPGDRVRPRMSGELPLRLEFLKMTGKGGLLLLLPGLLTDRPPPMGGVSGREPPGGGLEAATSMGEEPPRRCWPPSRLCPECAGEPRGGLRLRLDGDPTRLPG
mmetsp:Transcript_34054/g.96505  ORF Transcript_34054/g.96505 Transcript_34054/m.96505 type:complete len:127 (+) Transcript_34054:452-832(+)